MQKKQLLYISSNNASDTRINKELKTLSQQYDISFAGIGNYRKAFGKIYCKEFILIQGRRNRLFTMWKLIFKVAHLLRKNKYHSIHVINEQLMIFFYPFLFTHYVVLDVFDSIFLRLNKSGEKWKWIKKIVYAPADKIIVTDENRKRLMPSFLMNRICVVENFPYKYEGPYRKKSESNEMVVFYSGGLDSSRGTRLLHTLINHFQNIKVIMAGWISDEQNKILLAHPNVKYIGIIKQQEALQIAASECDYIWCMYKPDNENNLNASPNKIYDAIQAKTPVVINSEINIAQFVKDNRIGIVLDKYNFGNYRLLANTMIEQKQKFSFDYSMQNTFTWEHIEHILIDAHSV